MYQMLKNTCCFITRNTYNTKNVKFARWDKTNLLPVTTLDLLR